MRILTKAAVLAVGAAALAAGPARAQTAAIDTVIAVAPDGRLELHNGDGSIQIDTWDRAEVRVRARRSGSVPVRIEKKGVALVVDSPRQMMERVSIAYEMTVPATMDLQVHGMQSPVTIDGTRGSVEVHTIRGKIDVRGGRDRIALHSVNGPATVTGARGRVEVGGVNQAVTLRDVSGDAIAINTVNGAIMMDGVDAEVVEVVTVNGKIHFRGAIRPGGSYELNAHNGGIVLEVPEGTSARVGVSTFNGTLHTRFPVTIEEGARGKQFDFTLGSGEARIELTSFNGTIELRRPGS